MKIFLRIVGVIVLIALGIFGWWYFIDNPAPESRPDLVRKPAHLPDPPKGYGTLNALYLNYAMGRLDIMDEEELEGGDAPEGVEERYDVEYGRVGERALVLDLYTPKNLTAPAPMILFIHGGGWRSGDKGDYRFYTRHFAEQGYVVASIGYRLSKEAKYPAAVHDVKCAVRYVRAHAEELNIDPERIGVIGGSAGGHLAMMIGYSSDVHRLEGDGGWPDTSSHVKCVVNIYGPVDFTTEYGRSHDLTTSFIGKTYEEAEYLYQEVSPYFHLDETDPPTMILHGTLDDLVPITQADTLAAELEKLGIPYWYDRMDGWPHTMDLSRPVNNHFKTMISAFFDEYLKGDGTTVSPIVAGE